MQDLENEKISSEENAESFGAYVVFFHVKIKDVCTPPFETEYVYNKHPSRSIRLQVITRSYFQGNMINEVYSDEMVLLPGVDNKVELGCTGWSSPTEAGHTIYSRFYHEPKWV